MIGIDEIITDKIYNIKVFLEDLETEILKVNVKDISDVNYIVNYSIPCGQSYSHLKLTVMYVYGNRQYVDEFHYAHIDNEWIRMVK